MTKEEAQALLLKVVQEWWAETGRPLLGSQLKVRMLGHNPSFDEKEYQYRNFGAFVRACTGIALEVRGTTDFAVVPAEHAGELGKQEDEPTRIRPAFWRAFVGFPKEKEVRAYIVESRRVYVGPPEECPPSVPISPVPKESQLKWRVDFVQSLGDDSELKAALPEMTLQGGFAAFTRALEPLPSLRKRWHSVLVKHVATVISDWAKPLGLPDAVWKSIPAAVTESQGLPDEAARQRFYALLDRVHIDDLLELRLPVRWFLNIPPGDSKK